MHCFKLHSKLLDFSDKVISVEWLANGCIQGDNIAKFV